MRDRRLTVNRPQDLAKFTYQLTCYMKLDELMPYYKELRKGEYLIKRRRPKKGKKIKESYAVYTAGKNLETEIDRRKSPNVDLFDIPVTTEGTMGTFVLRRAFRSAYKLGGGI